MLLQCIVSTTNDVGLDNCGRYNDADMECIRGAAAANGHPIPQQYYLSSLFSYISQYSLAFMFACCFQLSLPPNHFCPFIIY